MSAQPTALDPNEEDPVVLWAEIIRLRALLEGPVGYESWQDAAVAERVRRVKAESALAAEKEAIQELRGAVQGLLDPATYEDGEWYREARDKARAALKSTEEAP